MRINVLKIRHEYAEKLYNGEKIFEIRRKPLTVGKIYYLYEEESQTITGFIMPRGVIGDCAEILVHILKKLGSLKPCGVSARWIVKYAGGRDGIVYSHPCLAERYPTPKPAMALKSSFGKNDRCIAYLNPTKEGGAR